jgi:transcriptional regulator with XRE-family HTH domain
MTIGQKLRQLRESKNLSQGDIQQRTGLIRCYTSRVENGHTVPSLATLEKYASVLEVPLYRLFYDGEIPPENLILPSGKRARPASVASKDERRELRKFAKAWSRMNARHRRLLLGVAVQMAFRNGAARSPR